MWTPRHLCSSRQKPGPQPGSLWHSHGSTGAGGPGGQDGQRQASERGSVELHGIGLSQGLHWRRETRVRKALHRGADPPAHPPQREVLPCKNLWKPAHPLNPERGERTSRSQFLFTCLILSSCVLGGKKGHSLCLESSRAILIYSKIWE